MANQTQATNKKQNGHQPKTSAPAIEPDVAAEIASLTPLSVGRGWASGEEPVERQIDLLKDTRYQLVQRQSMAREIGRRQGNRHLQNIIAAVQRRLSRSGSSENRRNGKYVQRKLETGVIQRAEWGKFHPDPDSAGRAGPPGAGFESPQGSLWRFDPPGI